MSVPQAWTNAVSFLRMAQAERDVMRNPDTPQAARDDATIRYSRAVDALVGALGMLSEQQVLGRITMFLARKDRV